ncbi:hypothetical protein ACFSJS_27055 [Streptomyces desertarenae]|uniref:Lipoprotein n=1 Tax=Streptomyces desertarenae TaxID=2666184 RepID=A0ABW4PT35_9ACTN
MRTSVRCAGAAAVLAAALLVSGCGSDGGSGGAEPGETAGKTTGPSESAGDGAAAEDGGVDGTWSSGNGEDALVLSISGGQAALLGATACTGPVDTGADPVTFSLTCGDGSTDRTKGTVESVDGKNLTVDWGSGTTDTFTRVEVPTGLPTEIGDLPTEIGDLPTDLDLELPTE